MRRAQIDDGSQPHWNLSSNPKCIDTNTAVIIRTNLALNPRGISGGFFGGYSQQNYSAATGIPSNPEGISTAFRVQYAAGNVNPGILFTNGLDPSTQYTVSAWVYQESQPPEGSTLAIALKGQASSASVSTAVGVWERLTWTVTSAAGIVAGNDFGIRLAGTAAGTGSFLVTGVLIEKSGHVSTYFDGFRAATADFTYDHSGGTPNNSPSREMGRAVSNVTSSGNALRSTYQITEGAGKIFRMLMKQSGVVTGINIDDQIIAERASRTDIMWIRASRAMTVTPRWRHTVNGTVVNTPDVVLVANTWTQVRIKGAPDITGSNVASGFLIQGSQLLSGDTIDIGNHGCFEGVYDGDLVLGDNPYSRWDGVVGTSQSVGYPPQLYDIAGKPSVDLVGVANTGGVAIPVPPFAARTIYVVYQAFGWTLSYQTCMYYGVSASKGFILQTAGAGSASLANRIDFPSGTNNGGIVLANGRQVRTHVAAFAFAEGLNSVLSSVNGNSDVSSSPNPGTGWDDGRAQTMANSPEVKAVRALVYYADHDRATRLAISRYLGNKYGAPVA